MLYLHDQEEGHGPVIVSLSHPRGKQKLQLWHLHLDYSIIIFKSSNMLNVNSKTKMHLKIYPKLQIIAHPGRTQFPKSQHSYPRKLMTLSNNFITQESPT